MNTGKPARPRRRPQSVAAAVLVLCAGLPLWLGPAASASAPVGSSSLPAASESCDTRTPVLVVGGTPAGVAAAVAAARTGTPVLMTEERPYLGGDLTGPMLNMLDMDFGLGGQQLAQGIFGEIFNRLGMTFDVDAAKRVFMDAVRQEPLITLELHRRPVEVMMRGPWVTGVVFEDPHRGRVTVCAKRVIDATDDGDIAAMAGAPFTIGREDSGIDRAMMSATLVFELGGVNWHQVVTYVTGVREQHMRRGGVYRGNVWGYGPIMRMYKPIEPNIGVYDLNLGLQNNHTVLINGLLVFDVDGTDPASVADGMRRAKAELPSLVAFLRETAPGFGKATLVRTADYLYIRETRHIRGLYTLTASDIVNSRVFWDAVGVASYPIDIHPYKPGELNPYAPKRFVYTIPFRSLVPFGTANLIMASRAISATYAAAASCRVAPTTMEEGQAAGLAAVLSLERRVSVRQLADQPAMIHELQAGLHAQGAFLLPETLASTGHAIPSSPERAATPVLPAPAAPTQLEGVQHPKP
ncbi:MAG TPA: FAD-dependent oxidoreductase [bacterium]|nr:FAD-dependent oxidoreductase [bacterium]